LLDAESFMILKIYIRDITLSKYSVKMSSQRLLGVRILALFHLLSGIAILFGSPIILGLLNINSVSSETSASYPSETALKMTGLAYIILGIGLWDTWKLVWYICLGIHIAGLITSAISLQAFPLVIEAAVISCLYLIRGEFQT